MVAFLHSDMQRDLRDALAKTTSRRNLEPSATARFW